MTAASGNLYIADTGCDCTKEVAGTGHAEFTQSMTADYIYDIAGTGAAGITGDGGIGCSAEVNDPSATALDSAGDMYLADTGNNRVREVFASCGDIAAAAGRSPRRRVGRQRDQSFQAAGGRPDAALLGVSV